MAAFVAKGDIPQWQVVYEMLCRLDIGDHLRYDDLCAALGVSDRSRVRGPVRKAAKRWGEERHRALVPVIGQGYRVADPAEHELIARSHNRKSGRSLGRSRAAIRNVDRSKLTPAEQARFDRLDVTVSRTLDMVQRLNSRTDRIQQTVDDDRAARQATDEKVARLEEAMRRHGIELV